MANDVVALLDHLKIPPAHFLGHSMGGRIALEMALNFPGRVKSLIMAASGSGQAATAWAGLYSRLAALAGDSAWLRKASRNSCATSFAIPDAFFTNDFRERQPDKVEEFFQLA